MRGTRGEEPEARGDGRIGSGGGADAERRRLYGAGLDPLIAALAAVAKTQGFERIILLRRYWHEAQIVEFARALKETGVEVQGANFATLDTSGHPLVNPVLAMPERLRPQTMYVVCTNANLTLYFTSSTTRCRRRNG